MSFALIGGFSVWFGAALVNGLCIFPEEGILPVTRARGGGSLCFSSVVIAEQLSSHEAPKPLFSTASLKSIFEASPLASSVPHQETTHVWDQALAQSSQSWGICCRLLRGSGKGGRSCIASVWPRGVRKLFWGWVELQPHWHFLETDSGPEAQLLCLL